MKLSVDELKQIQLYRQHLTNRADRLTVCRNLNGLQAQFMVNVEHSLRIRCNEKIEKDKFGDGLLKNWTIRGTVHVFAADDLPLYIGRSLSADEVCDNKFYQFMCDMGYSLTQERNRFFAKIIVDNIAAGTGDRETLKEICRSHGMTEAEENHIFNQWGGTFRELAEIGVICYKVREKKEYICCEPFEPIPRDAAQLEQIRRYFTHIGPATIRDAAYYFGWSQAVIKEAMKGLPMLNATVDGRDYFYLEEMKDDYPDVQRCILLSGFDQLMLGYQKQDSIYLPQQHLRGIFNLAGIVMPPILLDGVVVGRWRKKGAKMTFEMFQEVGVRNKKRVEAVMEGMFSDVKKVEWKGV